METKNNNSSVEKHFIRNILAVDIGLFVVAGFVSLVLKLSFGVTLFLLGILVGGIGAFLGVPDPIDPKNPRNLRSESILFRKRPVQDALDQVSYNAEHTVPRYAIENVMLYSGLIAIVISIPFLALLMF